MRTLYYLNQGEGTTVHIPDDLWVHIVYDAAAAYHRQVLPREHLLKSLTPLYLGRTASFVFATQGLTSAEAEQTIDHLCRTFEQQKPYLLERWNEPTLPPTHQFRVQAIPNAGGDHE